MGSEKSLSIPPVAQRDKASFEVLRVWIAEQGQHVSIRSGAWDDPFAWGIVLADLARHIALAHELQNKKHRRGRLSRPASSKASRPRSTTPPTNPKAKSPTSAVVRKP